MRCGILLKSATALERSAAIDTVVLDKAGTLPRGHPELLPTDAAPEDLRLAASLAGASRHPLARYLVRAVPGVPVAQGVEELAGRGMRLGTPEGEVRLGSRSFVGAVEDNAARIGPELWLARPGRAPVRLAFADALRPDAARVIAGLRRRGLAIELLSGDRARGRTARGRAWRPALAGRLHPGGEMRPPRRADRRRPARPDGRRQPERCCRARRRPCLALALSVVVVGNALRMGRLR